MMMASKTNQTKTNNRQNQKRNGRRRAKAKARNLRIKNAYFEPAERDQSRSRNNVARRRLKISMQDEYYDYLTSLLHPWEISNVILPDWSTFPRGTAQIRTTGIIKTGASPGNTGFYMTFTPALFKSLYWSSSTNATITIDGITYATPSQISVKNFTSSWANVLATFRVVSLGVRLKYVGTVFSAAGNIACAVTPPKVNVLTSYTELSAYNYAYTGAAVDGVSISWLPAGLKNFECLEPDYVWALDDTSVIQIAATGLPDSTSVYNMEWVVNIETYSTDQLLTANAVSGKPDAEKMSKSLAIAGTAMQKGLMTGKHDSSKTNAHTVLKEIAGVGEKLASSLLTTGVKALVSSI